MKLSFIVLLILLDYVSKQIVFNFIELNNKIFIFSFFDITHIRNYGVSFCLFANILPLWFILLLGITMTVILFYWMIKSSRKVEKWGLLLILTGAISNIGDRAINSYVLDFIFFHYKQHYWPAFNFADIYISFGVLLIIVQSFMIFKTRLKDNNV